MSQTFHTFEDLAIAMGVKVKKDSSKEKVIKCRICGSTMVSFPGNNVIKCPGRVKMKDGSEKPCRNYILTK